MIPLPDFGKTFEYENNFYLSCNTTRIGKMLAHYELYKMASNIPGAIIECGVFKGISLVRFAMFQELFNKQSPKKIIGFDVFDKFPETNFTDDKIPREKFIEEAGEQSISKEQLKQVLKWKGIEKTVELVEGDITLTIPLYVQDHPELKISLLNLDVDIYEPSVTILEYLYPRLVKGGILILDDYNRFPGETKAVNDYFKDKYIRIQKFSFCTTLYYLVKK